jgi:hypothetical protein
MSENIRNHNHITFDEVQKNQAVYALSRHTPINSGHEEPLDVLLARAEQVAEGMQIVLQQNFDNTQQQKEY